MYSKLRESYMYMYMEGLLIHVHARVHVHVHIQMYVCVLCSTLVSNVAERKDTVLVQM